MTPAEPAAPTCRISFQPVGKRVEVPTGTTVVEAARQAGLPLAADCGGRGACGQCRVTVTAGPVTPRSADETGFVDRGTLAADQRLACQTLVRGNVSVQIPRESLFTEQRLQTRGESRTVPVDPVVRVRELSPPPPSLRDPRPDLERVRDELESGDGAHGLSADLATIRQLSAQGRRTGWQMAAYLRGAEIVGFAVPGKGPVGLAADLGTTKVAGYLVDLQTGMELAAAGVANPQIAFGEDVVSRLAHAKKSPEAARGLAEVLRLALEELAGYLVDRAGVSREQIADACVVGNTAIIHLFLELPVGPLAAAPFVPATSGAIDLKARELGLKFAPGAWVHVPKAAGGFVGADHLAMILATGLHRSSAVTVGVDIGTNTEIVVCRPGKDLLLSASCASGPAFEGAHIRDGMRAARGAIEAVRLTPEGPRIKTIGDTLPVGLCGSGIVDAVAELRRTGVIDERGRLDPDAPTVRRSHQGNEFVLVAGDRSGSGRDLVITQADIEEIQLAKGAICAGVETLLEAAQVAADEVEEVVVAGAFGSHLDLESAQAMGLVPRLPRAGYRQVGNAAGEGAKLVLLSATERHLAAELGRRVRHTELNNQPGFSRRLARAMRFPNAAS